MNDTGISSSDLIFLVGAVAVSFALGSMQRIGRTHSRHRRAVDLTELDVHALSERCERQQASVSRLTQELGEVRQALMQQALAMAPVHAALHQAASAPRAVAPPPGESAPPAAATRRAAPAARPVPRKAAAAAPARPDPVALARAGAGADVLMARCGLSRAEAALVLSVHGKANRSAA